MTDNHPNDLSEIGQDEGTVTSVHSQSRNAKEEERRLFERKESSHKRSQQVRQNIHWVSLVGLWTTCALSFCFVIVWAWHILMPESRQFLTEDRLSIIQTVLISIVGSSFITGYGKSWLDRHSE